MRIGYEDGNTLGHPERNMQTLGLWHFLGA
jgi:hypothetical protein